MLVVAAENVKPLRLCGVGRAPLLSGPASRDRARGVGLLEDMMAAAMSATATRIYGAAFAIVVARKSANKRHHVRLLGKQSKELYRYR